MYVLHDVRLEASDAGPPAGGRGKAGPGVAPETGCDALAAGAGLSRFKRALVFAGSRIYASKPIVGEMKSM
jgi:hypothetical protein